MVMCLGLKSVTIYLPFYNIFKEVPWGCPVTSSGKDTIVATIIDNGIKN